MASASATVNHNVYYDTLMELDNDAQQLIDNKFKSDMADDSLIVTIFSNQQPIENLKPDAGKNPIIIITAGSPGVGKSTIAKEQFRKFGVSNPNRVYTVSMDTLLERNRLFRRETKKLYERVHKKKGEFTNANYARLSGIPTAAYKAKQDNLRIHNRIENITRKYAENGIPLDNSSDSENLSVAFEHFRVSSPNKTRRKKMTSRPTARSVARSPSRSPSRSRSSSPPKSRSLSPPSQPALNSRTLRRLERERKAALAATPKKGGANNYDLNDIREIGFEFGVANGLHILFDCTLSKTGTRMASIMEILQKYANRHKYEIKVLLIKADNDIDEAARIIKSRIEGRHHQMIRNGYLRSLTSSIPVIKSMIKQNKEGFDAAYELYGKNIVNPPYQPRNFYFEEIINSPH